jgi:hypothetical protein
MSEIEYSDDLPNPLSLVVRPPASMKRYLITRFGGRNAATLSSNLDTMHTAVGHYMAKKPEPADKVSPLRLYGFYLTVYREGQKSLFPDERAPAARPYWIPDDLRF